LRKEEGPKPGIHGLALLGGFPLFLCRHIGKRGYIPPGMRPTFCRPFFYTALAALASLACVKLPPPPAELNAHALEKLPLLQHWEQEAMRFVQTQNAWLWQHWTSGTPLEVEPVYAQFEEFFSTHTWKEMQDFPESVSHAQACALQNLQAFVLGELLALKLRRQNHAIALLENNLTVMYQAKDFPWHELWRLLAHEKDAVHRKNLWLYSLKKARALDAALQARQQQTAQVLEHLGVDEAHATRLFRDTDLGELSLRIQARLDETQAPWCAQVQAMAARQGDMDKASRADLPFFFQAKLHNSGRYFPVDQQAALVDTVFERLGLWPTAQLVRHIGEAQVAPPFPLALNGGFEASRLSFTPTPGPHSLRQLLGEMGRALSWTHVAPNQWACRHLGLPILSHASARVFAQLAQDKTWLMEQALPEPTAEKWERAFHAQTEFEFRKTAANFLSQWASSALSHEEAAGVYASIQAEVLCTQSLEAEAARLHVDGEEFFAMADQLRAHLLAEHMWEYLSMRFGKTWWHAPEAGTWLKALWHEGNASPAELLFERAKTPPPSSLIAASSAPPSSPQTLLP
jgi:hypothetical protein